MNKIAVASDSFKGTLSSREICTIAKRVIPEYFPGCSVFALPVADGGEGTVDSFLQMGAEAVPCMVTGPLFEPVEAVYARSGETAVIEMSAAAGLPLAGGRKDPEKTTTYGVGELIKHAVLSGCRRILIGLGGSATNDGGCGMAAALGTVFRDQDSREFVPVGGTLKDIAAVSCERTEKFLKGIEITAMCDVNNPLYGENGAAYIYGPQKGAGKNAVERLDNGLRHLAEVMIGIRGEDISGIPGSGAAGGMGAGCMWFIGAKLKPGTDAILEASGFDEALSGADYVITGEGRMDSQSLNGKLLSGVVKRAQAKSIPVIAIAGCIKKGDEKHFGALKKIYLTSPDYAPMEELKKKAKKNYEKALRSFCEDVKGGKV
ncbi:MAG: glycerate kinase [Firmicutes bacterium]|nr:glycerate kinase [Bacillota bacterium]